MFRKPKKTSKASFRKKKKSTEGDDGDGGGAAPKRKTFRKRSTDDGSSSDSDGGGGGEGGDGGGSTSALLDQIRRDKERAKGKKRRTAGGSDDEDEHHGGGTSKGGGGVMHEYKSADPSKQMSAKDMATRGAEYHPTEITQGGAAPPAASKSAPGGGQHGEDEGDGIYRGHTSTRNKFLAGPLKAPTFVRTTCRFDYQPDICKDYKDTGFCGFGDTCIYLHDRGDTMSGWQIEQQYEEKKKREAERKEREMERFLNRANKSDDVDGDESEGEDDIDETGSKKAAKKDDGIPFACHLCRGPFRDPVVTSCGHYFCQGCILDRVRGTAGGGGNAGEAGGDSTCPICSKDTHGVFNAPTKLETKKRKAVGRDGTWEDFMEASKRKKEKRKDDE